MSVAGRDRLSVQRNVTDKEGRERGGEDECKEEESENEKEKLKA